MILNWTSCAPKKRPDYPLYPRALDDDAWNSTVRKGNLATLGQALIKCDVESIDTDVVEKQRKKEHSWGDVKDLKKKIS